MNIGFSSLAKLGNNILDKVVADKGQREELKLELAKQEQQGQLEDTKLQLKAIFLEAQSDDPWTSRARPSFLYVMYIIILTSIPMGIVYAVSPGVATDITTGIQAFLAAIPDPLWQTMMVGYLGYTGARSLDKRNIMKNKK